MKYFCGVNGGGTKTLCAVADEDGYIVGVGCSSSSNISVVGLKAMGEVVRKAVNEAVERAELSGKRVDFMFLAVAGGGSELRRRLIRQRIEKMGLSNRVFVDSDATAALMATTLGKPGLVVISGTGSMVLGIDDEGVFHRACGWGHLVDDEGSAFYIGREALKRALMAFDGRGEPTALQKLIPKHFNVSSLMDVVDLISLRRMGVVEIAGLAPLVMRLWRLGDTVASEIVYQACRELAFAAKAVIDRMELKEKPLVGVCGGVFEENAVFTREFLSILKETVPSVKIVKPRFKPVVGALLLAYKCAGKQLNHGLIRNIAETASKIDSW